jgi:glycosyltransferase involved in cell wall biosynthesis
VRILFDHQIFSIQQYGGISRYFYELSSRLNLNHGAQTEILSPFYKNIYISSAKGVTVTGNRVKNFPMASKILSVINTRISNSMFKESNILHETYYDYPIDRPRNAQLVTTIHDMIHEIFPEDFGKNNQTSINKTKSILKSDHIICVSKSTKNDLINLFNIPEEKISVIHLGSSLSKSQLFAEQAPTDKPYFLYVGRRSGYKNFISLAKSIAASRLLKGNFSIVCFGGGEISKNEMLELHTVGFPLEDIIYRNGNDSALGWYYKNAAALVVPSHYEGFGIPLLEAMSLGCPVACSDNSSLPEVAGESAAYFNSRDISSITQCLESLASSPSLMKSLSESGIARINNFSWDKCAAETFETYNKMI